MCKSFDDALKDNIYNDSCLLAGNTCLFHDKLFKLKFFHFLLHDSKILLHYTINMIKCKHITKKMIEALDKCISGIIL